MNKKHQFRVGILTPYLTGDIIEKCGRDYPRLHRQIEKYGAQDIRDILDGFEEQEKGIYVRRSKLEMVLDLRPAKDKQTEDILQKADLIVVGCTSEVEQDVRYFKKTGLPFARCSIFYGKPSGYTGFTPEEAGYAFDVAKNKETVLSFITDETIGEAILQRDLTSLTESIARLNEHVDQPILITPWLEEVMKISRAEQKVKMELMIKDHE